MKSCKNSARSQNKAGYHHYGSSLEHRHVYATHYNVVLTTKDVIRHTCDNTWCVEITHLLIGTQKDNMQDRKDRGTFNEGVRNGKSYLTEEGAQDIIDMHDEGYSYKEIMNEFGMPYVTIHNIISGHTWKHLNR